jgi:hypothetical protein
MRLKPAWPWTAVALLTGLTYALIGVLFAVPQSHVQVWRLAAWGISAAVYAVHIASERQRPEWTHRKVASHVAAGSALGAFGLAVGANLHSLFGAPHQWPVALLLIALIAWPAITAVPAFVVGLGTSWVISHLGVGSIRKPHGRRP